MLPRTEELELGNCIHSESGRCRGPRYGEVYDTPGTGHPGYVVVTRSSADQSLFVGHRFHGSLPGKVTIEEAREAALNDAIRRNDG